MSRKNPGAQFAEQLARVDSAERKMRRAFNAWQRESSTLRRMGKRLDSAMRTADADNLPMEYAQ